MYTKAYKFQAILKLNPPKNWNYVLKCTACIEISTQNLQDLFQCRNKTSNNKKTPFETRECNED
jgi:hypothetical protein